MSEEFNILFSCPSAKKADLIALILSSQRIDHRLEKNGTRYFILTRNDDRQKAITMVSLYYSENKFFRFKQQIAQLPISSFKSVPAFITMLILSAIHFAVLKYHVHDRMVLEYGSSALYILQGETFRTITALFLHADTRHLLGNLAGILIFVAPMFSITGIGSGPFMLLLAGTTGNLINAYFYKTAHLSIGASTAIMGAAGFLAAFQVIHKTNRLQLNTFMPIFAATILVSLLSQGENTDVWAHIFGFISGVFYGLILIPLNVIIKFKHKQLLMLSITLIIIASAFFSGQ